MKSLFKKILFINMSVCFFLSALYSGEGTTAATFLKFSQSSRQSAMAGAYSAVGDDSGVIFSNPAGMVKANKTQISMGFTSYIQDTKLGLLSYILKKDNSSFGFAVSAFNVDGIEKRGLIDQTGVAAAEGTFEANDVAVFLSYAKKDVFKNLMDNLSAGVNFKIIRSEIYHSNAVAVAADIGFLYEYDKNINFAFVISNLGTEMKYEDEGDKLPLSIKAGAGYRYNNLNLSAEIEEYLYDEIFYPSFGLEYFLKNSLALRLGYRFNYDTSNLGNEVGFSAGFGIITKDVSFNYAYVPFGELGDINKFELGIKF